MAVNFFRAKLCIPQKLPLTGVVQREAGAGGAEGAVRSAGLWGLSALGELPCQALWSYGGPTHPSPGPPPVHSGFFFWPCRAACGILVPQPGIKPAPPAVEAGSLNHWTAREVPQWIFNNNNLSPCYGLNVHVPPDSYAEALTPSGMVFGGEALGS